jgi:ABC-type lipoprotein release transport system permease subunit
MSAFTFAARSLVRQPARSALGILGIAAVGALLFDMLLLSNGLVVSLRDLLDRAGFDVRVTATDTPEIGGALVADATALAQELRALPPIAEAVPLRLTEADMRAAGRHIRFTLVGMDPPQRGQWTLVAGQDPVNGDGSTRGLLVNRQIAAVPGADVGATVEVRTVCDTGGAALPFVTFTITGIAEFAFDRDSQLTGATTRRHLGQGCGEPRDAADMVLVRSREGHGPDAAVAAIRAKRQDLISTTNEQVVARMQQANFTYFRQISTVLSTITMLFGFLLITVLLTVSANQRLAEIAALRALGFSRARVAADILWQSVLLVGLGGVLALPLGYALAQWLDRILKSMPGIPAALHFFVFEPQALLLHGVLLAATAILAAGYPMWLVTRLPIATTLRNEVVS